MTSIEQASLSSWKRRFFPVWGGQAVSLISSEIVQFALVWWITSTTGSAVALSTAALLALLPRALLGPIAGALVDRWNRRLIMILSDSLIALALVWLGWLFWANRILIWHVYLVMFLRALGGCFQAPAMVSSTSLMVPDKHLPRISGLNQMMMGFVMVAAPPLGAALLQLMPFQGLVALDVGGTCLALLALLLTHIPQPPAAAERQNLWQDMKSGWLYLRGWRGAIWMLFLSMFINFVSRPAFTLIAIPVTTHFHGTEREYGWIGGVFGLGMMLGGITLGIWGGFRRRMVTSLMGIMGMGAGILLIGIAPDNAFPLAMFGMFLGGFMVPICMGPILALVQSTVQPGMQGRVVSIMEWLSTIITPLSLFIAGRLFERFGYEAWYIPGGLIAVVFGVVGFMTPLIRDLGAPVKSTEVQQKVSPTA